MNDPSYARAAIGLRLDGASWSEVAQQLFYAGPRSARICVLRAAERTGGPELVRRLRTVQPRKSGSCAFCSAAFGRHRRDRKYCSSRCRSLMHAHRTRDAA